MVPSEQVLDVYDANDLFLLDQAFNLGIVVAKKTTLPLV